MMQRIEDERLLTSSVDSALSIGHEHLRRLAAGATPMGLVAEALTTGGYLVRVAWLSQRPGGRQRGRKRSMTQSVAEIMPPKADRADRVREEPEE